MPRDKYAEKTKRISVDVGEDEYEALRKAAFEEETTNSAVIRRALRKELGLAKAKRKGK